MKIKTYFDRAARPRDGAVFWLPHCGKLATEDGYFFFWGYMWMEVYP